MKTCVVLRAASGAGKSTLAAYIKGLNFNADIQVACADDYFEHDGEYKFDASKLGAAHRSCQNKFLTALENGLDVVVANTNTTISDRNWYASRAKAAGYRVFSLVVENLGTQNVHNVPEEVLENQKKKLRNSIEL